MSATKPRTKLVFIEQSGRQASGATAPDYEDLRRKLDCIPEFQGAELSASGRSAVIASVPASNMRQHARLKQVAKQNIVGWDVVEEADYSLPRVF